MTKNEQKPHVSVAPMMDWTDRHCRYFLRLIAPNVRLYTEMVTCGALIHGDADRHLRFNTQEHPVALQLGGSDPSDMALCARMGEDYGYDEVNINCGCPSERVQKGAFGACLMAEPDLVARCVAEMRKSANIPVTVKCRIGIDELDSFEFLDTFVSKIVEAGCTTFIIHARKAWLKGLSPKQNREVPQLDYDRVKQVKEKYPQLEIILNGGIQTLAQTRDNLQDLDGVMIGREAYQNPYFLAEIEHGVFGNSDILSREEIARAMIPYIEQQQKDHGTPVKSITRHMLGLYHGQRGGKSWRRTLSELPYQDGARADLLLRALPHLDKIAA